MDYRISTKQFLDIVEAVWLESDYGDINDPGHPDDIYYTISMIVNTLGRGLGHYIDELRENANVDG